MEKPLLVYDGQCKFCRRQVAAWSRWTRNAFYAEDFHSDQFFQRYPQMKRENCERAVQLIMPNGRVYEAGEAFAQLCRLRWYLKPLTWIYYIPGLRRFWEWLYQNIATHRHRLDYWNWFRF